jgi:hypothetical protein
MTMRVLHMRCHRCLRYLRYAWAVMMTTAIASLSACGIAQPVQPWEKGTLARPEMTFSSNRLESKFDEHVYTSKEAASGGASVGGGGCGCN